MEKSKTFYSEITEEVTELADKLLQPAQFSIKCDYRELVELARGLEMIAGSPIVSLRTSMNFLDLSNFLKTNILKDCHELQSLWCGYATHYFAKMKDCEEVFRRGENN